LCGDIDDVFNPMSLEPWHLSEETIHTISPYLQTKAVQNITIHITRHQFPAAGFIKKKKKSQQQQAEA
jgi:hypothetical protein